MSNYLDISNLSNSMIDINDYMLCLIQKNIYVHINDKTINLISSNDIKKIKFLFDNLKKNKNIINKLNISQLYEWINIFITETENDNDLNLYDFY
jgi:transcriptional regulator of heat shock response